jgi:hypothetical protein
MDDEEKAAGGEIHQKNDLPTSIIIKSVPKELFEDVALKQDFAGMFTQISPDVRIDYLKGFQRVRVVFTEPEHATAAKLLIEHHKFNGHQLKAFFAQNIKMTRRAYQDEEGHLTLPPLEKQFLISPPTSPPVGWTQVVEMAPVVCDFDLMARLAAYSIDDKYEVHEGDANQPAIVVTPAVADREKTPSSPIISEIEAKEVLPRTPRPP